MAIYHLSVKVGSKAKGQSAKAKLEYLAREGRYRKDKSELEHTQSANMPEWVETPKDYWDKADIYERVNGRLFCEIEFALPRELSEGQRKELVLEFAQELTAKENLPYTLAIHRGKGENPHAHLMISERKNDGVTRPPEQWFKRHNSKSPAKGGAKKSEVFLPPEWVGEVRERWANMANEALEKAGLDERIDHRSYKEQGVDKIPGVHIGPNVLAMDRRAKTRANPLMELNRPRRMAKILELDQWRNRLEELKREKEAIATKRQEAEANRQAEAASYQRQLQQLQALEDQKAALRQQHLKDLEAEQARKPKKPPWYTFGFAKKRFDQEWDQWHKAGNKLRAEMNFQTHEIERQIIKIQASLFIAERNEREEQEEAKEAMARSRASVVAAIELKPEPKPEPRPEPKPEPSEAPQSGKKSRHRLTRYPRGGGIEF